MPKGVLIKTTCSKCGDVKENQKQPYCNLCKAKWSRQKGLKYKDYTEDQKMRQIARSRLQTRIKSGKIKKQPCVICGSSEKIEAHHDDYSKPLEVTWFCRPHHVLFHMLQ